MASANLFASYLQPVKSVADYSADMDRRDLLAMQLEGQQRQNAISGIDMQGKIGEMREARRQQEARRSLSYTNPEQWVRDLRSKGLHADAGAFEKEQAELAAKNAAAQENKGKALKSLVEAQGFAATQVLANPTVETARAAVMKVKQFAQHLGIDLNTSEDERIVSTLQNPEDIRRYFAGQALAAKELLPKLQTTDAGNAKVQQAVDPLTGQARETGRTPIMQSPDNAASVGATIRGQNVSAETARLAREQSADQHRQTLEQGGKPPSGYRWKADGTMEAIPGGPADQKLGGPGARVQDARDVLDMLNIAEPLIDKATNSFVGAGIDLAARGVGASTPGAQAAAELKALEGALISKMPKMAGPQSDKDVMLYRQMAGQIGDSTIPAETKKAAVRTIRQLNERYAGNKPAQPASPKPTVSNW